MADAAGHAYWVGLGSNLGDRGAALQGALDALRAEGVCVEAVSPVFETAPQDLVDQPAFLNAAARVRTRLDPRGLLALLKRIERTLGRVPEGVRFGPRPIDADILLWDGGAWRDEALEIPHPRLVRRRFAMAGPLAVDPGVPLPDGGPLADAFAAIDAASQPVRRLPATEASLH
ncbi:MAG: 2-amino-4-hydroxy-6-hydroxymethyldihydropteridine diphosphokinase [Thermoleophilia bacterium]|nr:2-amino-4-hydroxy-6-hydroxymethyldihydropteridine diphosphokinase [Thermoleophilia bacterium]